MNKVTPERIKSLLDHADKEEFIAFGKVLVIEYRLENGFTICGRGACVDPTNFDADIGRKVARENAEHQLWQLEGYLLQQKLFEEHKTTLTT